MPDTSATNRINTFITKFKLDQEIEKANGNTNKLSKLFDNFISIRDDLKIDKKTNEKVANNIKNKVTNAENSEKAAKLASNKAARIKKDKTWGNIYTVTKNGKATKNGYEFNIKDADGKTGKVSVKYAEDGSCVLTMKIGDRTVEKTYDKDGVLREQVTKNNKNKTTTTVDYDASGKPNCQKVKNIKTGLTVSSAYYDDNGQVARKSYWNEEGIIKETRDYEYDKNGNLIGRLLTVKDGADSDLRKEVGSIVSTYSADRKTKTEITYSPNGDEVSNCSYIKNEAGEWELESQPEPPNDNDYETEVVYGDNGEIITNYYDKNHNKVKETKTDSNGNKIKETNFEYDSNGNKIKSVCKDYIDNYTFTENFDSNGNKINEILEHSNGNITETIYENNVVAKKIYKQPDGTTTIEEYDSKGNVISGITRDADGNLISETNYEYDSNGNKINEIVEYADGTINETIYENNVIVKRIFTKPDGTTTEEYDSNGNVISGITRDADGNLISETNYEYDSNGTKIKSVCKNYKDNYTFTENYDSNGNKINEILEHSNGNITETIYENNVVAKKIYKQPDGTTTIEEYDSKGNVISGITRDADGNLISETNYEYDSNGNKIKSVCKDYIDNCTFTENFDSNGNIIKEIYEYSNGNINETIYENGIIAKKIYKQPDGTTTIEDYDSKGNVISEITRDADGNLISETSYEYDSNGNLLKLDKYNYVYENGKLKQASSYNNDTDEVYIKEYDNMERIVKETYLNTKTSVESTKEYDYENNSITYKCSNTTTNKTTIGTYDINGNPVQEIITDYNSGIKSIVDYSTNPPTTTKEDVDLYPDYYKESENKEDGVTVTTYYADSNKSTAIFTITTAMSPDGTKIQTTNYSGTEFNDDIVKVFDNNNNLIKSIEKQIGSIIETNYSNDKILITSKDYIIGSVNYTKEYDSEGYIKVKTYTDKYNGEEVNIKVEYQQNGSYTLIRTDKSGKILTSETNNPNIYYEDRTSTDNQINENIDAFKQNRIGDCWLLASLNALSYSAEGQKMLTDAIEINNNIDGNTTYTVTLKGFKNKDGSVYTKTYTKDDIINVNSDFSTGDNDAKLIEIALEDAYRAYVDKEINVIEEGHIIPNLKENYKISGGNISNLIYSLTGFDGTELVYEITNEYLNYLQNESIDNVVMTEFKESCSIYDIFGNKKMLVAGHAYSVKSITDNTVTVVNPWDSTTDIIMSREEFLSCVNYTMSKNYSTQSNQNTFIMIKDNQGRVIQEIKRNNDGGIEYKIDREYVPNTSKIAKETQTNSDGNITKVINFKYDSKFNKIKETETDSNGNIIKETDFEYDLKTNKITKETITDSNGNIIKETDFEYDLNGTKIKSVCKDYIDNYTFTENFDSNGNKLNEILEYGDGTINETIYKNNVVAKKIYKQPDGTTTIEEYNSKGNVISEITRDADGNLLSETNFKYDSKGNVISKITRDTDGNLLSETSFEYDSNGNKIKSAYKDYIDNYTFTENFDSNGNKINEILEYGDGTIDETIYENNVIVRRIYTRPDGTVIIEEI